MTSSRRAAGDIAIQVVGRLGNLVLGVVVTVLIVRLLGDRGFGQWTTLLALVQIFGYLADLGIEQVAVRRAAADPEAEDEWVGALLVLRLVLAGVAMVGATIIVLVLSETDAMLAAGLILCLGFPLSAPTALRVAFQLRVRNDVTVALVTVNSVLWTGGVAVLALGDGGLVALAALEVAVGLVADVALVILALRRIRPRFGALRERIRDLLRIGLPVSFAALLVTAYAKIDQVLVFELRGAREAGLYGAAYRVLDQAQFVPISVMTTLFPLIAAAHPADPLRVRRLVQLTADLLGLGALPALAFAIAAATPVMTFVFGAEFAAAAPALPILMAAFVLVSAGYLAGNLVVVLERQRRFVRYAAAGLVVNVALNLAFVPAYGFLAAAWATLLTEAVVTGLTIRMVLSDLRLRLELERLTRAAVAAALMGVAVYLAARAGVPAPGLLALAGIAFVAAATASGALRPAELRALARKELL